MKDLRLTVTINRPISEVFEFTTNPDNTSRWIDSITKEEKNTEDIQVGTKYQNYDKDGTENKYVVSQFELNKVFQLDSTVADYKVRYTYTPIDENITELEYYEWSEKGELHAPFMQEILDKLKEVIENE